MKAPLVGIAGQRFRKYSSSRRCWPRRWAASLRPFFTPRRYLIARATLRVIRRRVRFWGQCVFAVDMERWRGCAAGLVRLHEKMGIKKSSPRTPAGMLGAVRIRLSSTVSHYCTSRKLGRRGTGTKPPITRSASPPFPAGSTRHRDTRGDVMRWCCLQGVGVSTLGRSARPVKTGCP